MDALSDVLRGVGLTGGVFMDAEFTAPWSVKGKVAPELCAPFMDAPAHVVSFHYIVEGGVTLRPEDGTDRHVGAGEAVMLPRNDQHVMGSELRAPVSVRNLLESTEQRAFRRLAHGGGGARTRMVCGFLGGDANIQPLLSSLPAVLVVDVAGLPGGDWMARTFTYAAEIFAKGDPGAATVMARTAELLFVEAVRRRLAQLPAEEKGWLAGLRDPAIGRALALMHARLAESWTAEALAREVHLSRSAFAERFAALIGAPPMRYLTSRRMQAAAQTLRRTDVAIARIAYEVGYESEAAFNRAFRREFGAPPAAWRKRARAG